ncbi:tetratricopeptide repeat protein [Virgibacillus sp. FSP13]
MEQLKTNDCSEEEKGRWNGMLGFFLRIVGELEESEKSLHTSIEMYNDLDNQHGVFTNKLGLAHTYQWWTKYEMSNQLFNELLEIAETDSDYTYFLDFVYQHCGKNEFDQKSFPEALSFFEKALELRLEKGDQELISQTESAIEACNYRLENQG